MALIGTLRDKMGIVLLIFIFVALAAFILGDLLTNNSALLNQNEVGEINGHSISYEEFQSVVEERRANYILNFNRQPGEREMTSLRQQAWELLIARYAIVPEYEKVGIEVTDSELVDMISGTNIDPNIRQAKGTGLGLSITKGIIELHGGEIWVESDGQSGSRFSFTIPKTIVLNTSKID